MSVVAKSGWLDITGAERVDVQISGDGSVMWMHTESGLVLRICQIEGAVEVTDMRHPDVVKRRQKRLTRPKKQKRPR